MKMSISVSVWSSTHRMSLKHVGSTGEWVFVWKSEWLTDSETGLVNGQGV